MKSAAPRLTLLLFSLIISLQVQAKVDPAQFQKVVDLLKQRPTAQCQNSLFANIARTGQIRIAVIYGYNDQRPYVNVLDSVEKTTLLQGLTAPCNSPADRLCGFSARTPESLAKSILFNGARVDLQIDLISSSVSQNDDWNRSAGIDLQRQQSQEVRSDFSQALLQSDIVFYVGHARGGGGPDFNPPRIKDNSQVDLASYRSERAGINLLLEGLKSTRKLKALGLFSCNSSKLFAQELKSTRDDIGYILAGNISVPTIMNSSMWASLDGVLGPSCHKDIQKMLTLVNGNGGEDHFLYLRNRP